MFCRVVKELTVASDMGRAHGHDGVGEILHQLRCVKPWQNIRESPYQLVRYFFHQQYPEDTIYVDQVFTYTAVFSSTTTGCVVIVVRNNFPPLFVLLKTFYFLKISNIFFMYLRPMGLASVRRCWSYSRGSVEVVP